MLTMFGTLVLAICSFTLGMVVGERSANEANKKKEATVQQQHQGSNTTKPGGDDKVQVQVQARGASTP